MLGHLGKGGLVQRPCVESLAARSAVMSLKTGFSDMTAQYVFGSVFGDMKDRYQWALSTDAALPNHHATPAPSRRSNSRDELDQKPPVFLNCSVASIRALTMPVSVGECPASGINFSTEPGHALCRRYAELGVAIMS